MGILNSRGKGGLNIKIFEKLLHLTKMITIPIFKISSKILMLTECPLKQYKIYYLINS